MVDEKLSEEIRRRVLEAGYDDCGILPITDLRGYKKLIEARLEKFPHVAPIYAFSEMFCNLETLYPWAKSVIVCTFYIGRYRYPASLRGRYAKSFMLSPDTVPQSPEHQKKTAFEDWLREEGIRVEGGETGAPARLIPLRYAAVQAGLGIFRKNNFFYGEKGSFYNLEGYLIDRECELRGECHVRPCSEKCNLCQRACPTGSLSAPFTMDPFFCVSFLTTFGGGMVPPPLKPENLGTWVCGCDACQDACPHNRHNWDEGEDFFGLDDIVELLDPVNILAATDEELCEKVIPKTELHIPPEKVGILRTCAARVTSQEL